MKSTIKRYPYVVSCDWFAFSCLSSWAGAHDSTREQLFREESRNGKRIYIERRVGDVITYKHYEFRVCESQERNPQFACAVRVTWNDLDICHLFYFDKRDPSATKCVAKVANSLLYMDGWPAIFTSCLRACGWRIVRVNRVDVCCDFECFANGRMPHYFIHDYISEPTASRPSFVRRGSNKYRLQGERSIRASLMDTISWGTRDSPVQVNLYNKTKELMEVHNKPWIVAKWESNGLHSGRDAAGRMHYVWRVEFSINPSALAFRTKNRDQVFDASLSMVENQAALAQTFQILVPRYFQFCELPVGSRDKKMRDLCPVVLFDVGDESNIVPMTLNRSVQSGRTERLVSKRLGEIFLSRKLADRDRLAVERTMELFDRAAATQSCPEIAPADRVLAQFLVGLRLEDKPAPYRLTQEQVERQASRMAKLIARAKSDGWKEFQAACDLLQEEITDTRRQLAGIYAQLPDEYYATELEYAPSPYDPYLPDEYYAAEIDQIHE